MYVVSGCSAACGWRRQRGNSEHRLIEEHRVSGVERGCSLLEFLCATLIFFFCFPFLKSVLVFCMVTQ